MDKNVYTQLYLISSKWRKYTKYTLEQQEEETFIVADETSNFLEYNPYEEFPDILFDLFTIEDFIPYELRGKLYSVDFNLETQVYNKVSKQILKFVNKYGLLGLNEHKANNPNQISLKTPQQLEMMKMFKKNINTNYKRISSKISNDKSSKMKWGNNNSADSLKMFLDALEMLYRYKLTWDHFINNDFNPEDICKPIFSEPISNDLTWSNFFEQFGYSKYNLHLYNTEYKISLQYNKTWQLNYDCHSLLSSLFLMISYDILSRYESVVFCKRCKKPFIKKSSKTKYCSPSCGTYMRVKTFRQKK